MISFGVFGLGGSILSFWPPSVTDPTAHRMLAAMQGNHVYATWQKLINPVHAVASVAAIVGGIGILRLRPWGRRLAIGYGLWFAAKMVASAILSFLYLVPALEEQAKQTSGAAGLAIHHIPFQLVLMWYVLTGWQK